jgi:hypothetical protein
MSETVTINDVEVPKEEALGALNRLDPHGNTPVRVSGTEVLFRGDGMRDEDFEIGVAEEKPFEYVTGFGENGIAALEDVIAEIEIDTSDFEQFVAERPFGLETCQGQRYRDADADFVPPHGAVLGSTRGKKIDQSDDVELAYIVYVDEGEYMTEGDELSSPELRIGLNDTRDE